VGALHLSTLTIGHSRVVSHLCSLWEILIFF